LRTPPPWRNNQVTEYSEKKQNLIALLNRTEKAIRREVDRFMGATTLWSIDKITLWRRGIERLEKNRDRYREEIMKL